MKRLISMTLVAVLAICCTLGSKAITKEEMEEARTISAMIYLNYKNNNSEYLKKLSAKSIPELEKDLKDKEKENLKIFMKISVPADVNSWDKDQMVKFWSDKVGALDEKGKEATDYIRRDLRKMKVTAPGKADEKKEEEKKEAEDQNVAADQNTAPASPQPEIVLEDSATVEVTEPEQKSEGGTSTAVYVIILVILVLIVLCIIIYAINSMKRGKRDIAPVRSAPVRSALVQPRRPAIANATASATAAESDKDAQIATLKNQVANLTQEVNSLRRQLQQQQHHQQYQPQPQAQPRQYQPEPQPEPQRQPQHQAQVQPVRQPAETYTRPRPISPQNPRTIFLAQANQRGVFVRADASYNMGNSIFKLVTTDGVSGNFTVIEDPIVFDLALTVPADYLMSACAGENLQLAKGMREIVNDAPGTAVFEDGRWRVLRKARIHYER